MKSAGNEKKKCNAKLKFSQCMSADCNLLVCRITPPNQFVLMNALITIIRQTKQPKIKTELH